MQAAKTYEKMGAELVECSMPSLKYAVAAYYLIASAEASSNLSRYDGIKYGHRSKVGDTFQELICNSRSEGFGSEVKRRILLGNYALSSGYYDAYYGKAMALKQRISAEYAHIFETCDVILTPTTPSVAYGVHENVSDPVKMYQQISAPLLSTSLPCRLFLHRAATMQTVCRSVCRLSESSLTRQRFCRSLMRSSSSSRLLSRY